MCENFEEFKVILADNSSAEDEVGAEKETLKSKVGELNRRAYKLILMAMFRELDVEVHDDDLKLLVSLRNRIIHSGVPNYEIDPNMSEATILAVRFSSLVEKTLLAILEYRGNFELYEQSVTPVNL